MLHRNDKTAWAGWLACKSKSECKCLGMREVSLTVLVWWYGTERSGTERMSSGGTLQCVVVLWGFCLVVCYSVQWYWEDFVWWHVTMCSGTVRISSGGMLHCTVGLWSRHTLKCPCQVPIWKKKFCLSKQNFDMDIWRLDQIAAVVPHRKVPCIITCVLRCGVHSQRITLKPASSTTDTFYHHLPTFNCPPHYHAYEGAHLRLLIMPCYYNPAI